MWNRPGIPVLASFLAFAVNAEPSEQNSRWRNASKDRMSAFEQQGYLVVRPSPASPGTREPDAGWQVLLSQWPRGEVGPGEDRGPDLLLTKGQYLWPNILTYARAYGPEMLVRTRGYRFPKVDDLWRVEALYPERGAKGLTGLVVHDVEGERIPWTIRFGLSTQACGEYPRLTMEQGPMITGDGAGRVDVWVEITEPVPQGCQVLENRSVDISLDLKQFGNRPMDIHFMSAITKEWQLFKSDGKGGWRWLRQDVRHPDEP